MPKKVRIKGIEGKYSSKRKAEAQEKKIHREYCGIKTSVRKCKGGYGVFAHKA